MRYTQKHINKKGGSKKMQSYKKRTTENKK